MKLKNNSARAHWFGNVLIAPMETKEVDPAWRNAYNKQELEEVKDVVNTGSDVVKTGSDVVNTAIGVVNTDAIEPAQEQNARGRKAKPI